MFARGQPIKTGGPDFNTVGLVATKTATTPKDVQVNTPTCSILPINPKSGNIRFAILLAQASMSVLQTCGPTQPSNGKMHAQQFQDF
jgi:hypothetical protein